LFKKKFNISNNSLYGRFKFMRYYINELFLLFLILFICSLTWASSLLTAASSLLTAANFSLVSVSLSFAIKRLLSEFIKSCFASFNSLIFFLRPPFKRSRDWFTSSNSSVFANNSPVFIAKRSSEDSPFLLFLNGYGNVSFVLNM